MAMSESLRDRAVKVAMEGKGAMRHANGLGLGCLGKKEGRPGEHISILKFQVYDPIYSLISEDLNLTLKVVDLKRAASTMSSTSITAFLFLQHFKRHPSIFEIVQDLSTDVTA